MVRSTGCYPEKPRVQFLAPTRWLSQPSVTLVPRHPMPSSDFLGHCVYMLHWHTYQQNINLKEILKNELIKSSLLNVCACVSPTVAVCVGMGDVFRRTQLACGSCFCLSPRAVLRLELRLSGLAVSPVTHWSISLVLALLVLILWLWYVRIMHLLLMWWVWNSLVWDFFETWSPCVAHRNLELSLLVLGPWGPPHLTCLGFVVFCLISRLFCLL